MRRNIEINLQQDEWEKKDSFQGYQEEESLSPLFIIFTTEEDTVDDAVQGMLGIQVHLIIVVHIPEGNEGQRSGRIAM